MMTLLSAPTTAAAGSTLYGMAFTAHRLRPAGGELAGLASADLRLHVRRAARTGEDIVPRARVAGVLLTYLLAHLRIVLHMLAHLRVAFEFTGCRLRPISGLLATDIVRRGLCSLASLRVLAKLAGRRLRTLASLAVVERRRFDTALLQRLAGPFALAAERRRVMAAKGIALFAAGQALAVLLATDTVTVRHTIAVKRVVLPVVLVGIEPVVDVDVVVTVHVDVDIVMPPVAIAPERVDDRHTRGEPQAGSQRATEE